MRTWKRTPARGTLLLSLACALLASCGGGGGASGGTVGSGGGSIGALKITASSPTDGAVQVDPQTAIEIEFDGAVDAGSLRTEEFTLRKVGETESVPGSFEVAKSGKLVRFQPSTDLSKATSYEFTVQATVCDANFRTLDDTWKMEFRSFDDIPPKLLTSSVQNSQTSVSRTGTFTLVFDEALDAASVNGNTVTLKDEWGTLFAMQYSLTGSRLDATPWQDLPGNRKFYLKLRGGNGGIEDRSANALEEDWSISFRTAPDYIAPTFVSSDPATQSSGVSPKARLAFRFSESMDPASYEPSGVSLLDAYMNPVPFQFGTSRDKKTIYFTFDTALQSNEDYTARFVGGATGLADVSGNSVGADSVIEFHTGTDTTAPRVDTASPQDGATRISPNVAIDLDFSEGLKSASVTRETVKLFRGTEPIYITPALSNGDSRLSVIPSKNLLPNTRYRLWLASGYDGILDKAGNPLAEDYELSFTTSESSELPTYIITPGNGSSGVPRTGKITILASEALDPVTVTSSTVRVRDSTMQVVSGSLSLARANRAILFTPASGLPSGATLTVTVLGEIGGVRTRKGNWASRDEVSSFSVGYSNDSAKPELSFTLNGISMTRNSGLVVPPLGFTIDFSMFDPGGTSLDPTSLDLRLTGPGSVPSSDELFEVGVFTPSTASIRLDSDLSLPAGRYSLSADVADLSGNRSPASTLDFEVVSPSLEMRPFERTQLCWVRFDSDREGKGKGDGIADFDEDLIDLGLMAKGDPIGKNAKLRQIVIDGVLAKANELFDRAANSSPRENSVNIRLVTRQPCSAPHMQIAVGGPDPNGSGGRTYGSKSTGILGRALYDYRNAHPNENDAGTTPGLGVFLGELFLYQAYTYIDLYPYYITTFGRTFRGLSPHMGGAPAGTGSLDSTVLADTFSYGSATTAQRARYDEIMDAADDIAVSLGTILAHEVGHSLGLVASGTPSKGLHGDASLHNSASSFTDVMSAVISYESLITASFKFRPINMAYLRERILLK